MRPGPRITRAAAVLLLAACGGAPGGDVYVTSGQSDEVVRLRAADGSEVRRIPVNRMRVETDEPHAVAVSPDGHHWYVTVAHGQPSLWKFESRDDRLVGRLDLPTGGAAMIGLTADGQTAFIPDYDRAGGRTGRVAAVRLRDLTMATEAEVCAAPHEAAPSPSGERVAVVCAAGNEVVIADASDLSVLARVPAPAPAAAPTHATSGHMGTGARPLSAAWSPSGRTLAIALHGAGAVWLLDTDGAPRGLVSVGAGPAQVVFIDEARLVTANRLDGSLSLVDVTRRTETLRVPLGVPFPHGVALDSDGQRAFVAYEGTPESDGGVVAVDLESGRPLWNRTVGRYVLAIAFLPEPD